MIRLIRDQSVRTPMNVKVACAENHFPMARLLEFLLLIVEVMLNELLVRDHA
jgi:hypothetical protein